MTWREPMYLEAVLDRLTSLLEETGRSGIDLADVLFALDEDVAFEDLRYKVDRTKLVAVDHFDVFNSLFTQGSSWVHANLVLSSHKPYLITLRAGSPVGAPRPSINVSIEEREVDIIDST
jgi:hypothetical protein